MVPDGKWIAYVTQLDPHLFDYATKHLAIASVAGSEARVLTLEFDRMVSNPHFSPDGKFIYFIADDDGTQNVCRIPITGGEITRPFRRPHHGQRLFLGQEWRPPRPDRHHRPPDELYTIPMANSPKSPTPTTPL